MGGVLVPDEHANVTELDAELSVLGASRVVIGHTVQERGINAACGGRVWRVDVGLSQAMMSAPSQALEIRRDGGVRVLAER